MYADACTQMHTYGTLSAHVDARTHARGNHPYTQMHARTRTHTPSAYAHGTCQRTQMHARRHTLTARTYIHMQRHARTALFWAFLWPQFCDAHAAGDLRTPVHSGAHVLNLPYGFLIRKHTSVPARLKNGGGAWNLGLTLVYGGNLIAEASVSTHPHFKEFTARRPDHLKLITSNLTCNGD